MKNNNSIVLVLECSTGCQHNCTGCRIDKDGQGMPSVEALDRTFGLFSEMKQNQMDFYEIELGPTDLFSASNKEEIFGNETLRDLAAMFKITTLNVSFIHPNKEEYVEFAKKVHEFSPNNWIGLAIPIEMKHVFNDKYIDLIRENVAVFQSALPNFLKEVVLTVIFDENYIENAGSKYTYEQLFDRCNSLSVHKHTMVDFIFHHGRKNIKSEFVAEAFKTSVTALNKQYLLDLERRGNNAKYRHVPAQMLPESHNNELVLYKDSLYIRPVLNERVTLFHDKMKFIGEWTYENFIHQSHVRLCNNLSQAYDHPDCRLCDFQYECASNYVHDLLGIVQSNKCLLLKRELKAFDLKQDFKQ